MSQVDLILVEAVHGLGEAGDLVAVKPGYARNYLVPQGKAILATESKMRELGHKKRIIAEKVARDMSNLQAARAKLEGTSVSISARAGDEGKLFGSVTTAQIAELLAAKGFEIDRRRIDLREPIKEVGEHSVPVKLHRDISANIQVVVTAEGGTVEADDDDVVRDPDEIEDRRRRASRRRADDDDDDDDDSGKPGDAAADD